MNITKLNDQQKLLLIQNRWNSSSSIWEEIKKIYDSNTAYYDNNPDYMKAIPKKKVKVRANRIFTNTEAVINTLIANPPKPNFLPTHTTQESKDLALTLEQYFNIKYQVLDVKSVIRKGLRNLYFCRLILLKPFWNPKINDFDVESLDPRKVRFSKKANNEQDTDFVIEEIEDSLLAVIARFPTKKAEILAEAGQEDNEQLLIENPEIKYKEAWIKDRTWFSYGSVFLGDIPNPYWDWKGILITEEEATQLNGANALAGSQRRDLIKSIKDQQSGRGQPQASQVQNQPQQETSGEKEDDEEMKWKAQQDPITPNPTGQQNPQDGTLPDNPMETEAETFQQYFFNHFDSPRKPYIFATVFSNESKPIGRTDPITQAQPLQENINRRKMQIDDNANIVNGIWKVNSSSMERADAQQLRAEAEGVIWGKDVVTGVMREMGTPLPQFIFEDMQDSKQEIDNIMAAQSAFRGERQGEETKAGRLALIDQSQMMLTELTQVVDYVCYELFNWFYQLAKTRYTEYHYAKTLGADQAVKILEIIQDDFEEGAEVRIIPGKTLPEDKQFKMQTAHEDMTEGVISPEDYYQIAGYEDPKNTAKNLIKYKMNPAKAVGMSDEEMKEYSPSPPQAEPKEPSISISFKDVPPEGQTQILKKVGIDVHPEAIVRHDVAQKQLEAAAEAQKSIMGHKLDVQKANLEAGHEVGKAVLDHKLTTEQSEQEAGHQANQVVLEHKLNPPKPEKEKAKGK